MLPARHSFLPTPLWSVDSGHPSKDSFTDKETIQSLNNTSYLVPLLSGPQLALLFSIIFFQNIPHSVTMLLSALLLPNGLNGGLQIGVFF